MRRVFGLVLALGLAGLLSARVTTQAADLRILDAGPVGEVRDLAQVNEIRVVFSEPMVPLGRVPQNPTPSWMHITPAITGTYRWSGTTILIFTPDPAAKLPFATRFTVTVDATATSDAGRRLAAPFTFSFSTPTLKLSSMRWYRRQNRMDQPVVLVLDFNQRVRGDTLLPHLAVRYEPHDFEAPQLSERERGVLEGQDPEGLRRFDAKVIAARQASNRRDVIRVRETADWDKTRFPPRDTQLVLETTTVPVAGTWLALTVDTQAVGAEGSLRPAQAQTSVAELPPVFFASGFRCSDECNPSSYNGLQFTTDVNNAKFAAALTARDITDPARGVPVARSSSVKPAELDDSDSPSVEDAGYDRQPPARTYLYRLDPSLTSVDGQTLGYPWIGIVENWHETAFTSFGDGHGVWESDGGPQLPFYSRNFQNVTQWLSRLTPATLMPRIVALEGNNFRDLPPGAGTARRLTVRPDATQSYGIDLSPALTNGRGLVWAGVRPGTPIAKSERAVAEENADRSSIVQVTNLGITVKDSPQSTLVFVTRLDDGQPVADAAVSVINTSNRQLWRGTTGADGVAMAPALPVRETGDWYKLSFIVTAEKGGDVAYVASDWNEGILPWDFGHSYELWESADILRGSIFTDRGVYRPGEEVHAKAIVRIDTPTGIRLLPAGATLSVTMTDSRNKEVDKRTITVNRWSSAEWTWTAPAESTLGSYSIRAELPRPSGGAQRTAGDDSDHDWLRRVDGEFLVAAYRRPDFRVDAALSAASPVAGATLAGRIDARYLFGSAMARRPVKWSVFREPSDDIPTAITERFPEDRFVFGYSADRERERERVAGDEASLDASGGIAVQTTATSNVDFAYRYTLEGDVEDVSRQHIANRASLVVHPAPWYVGIRRPAYFTSVDQGSTIDIVAVGLDGAPVAGVPITVSLTRVQWNSVRRAEGGGFYTWDTEEVRVPAGEWTVTSQTAPVPVTLRIPEGGFYEIAAVGRDAVGHVTKTEASFYGVGAGYTAWQRFDHNRIDLEPEKNTWKPGETARVMIKSPWETATALLTLEREGVRTYRRFALTSTQQTVEVPVTEADIPNVFVSVLLIRGRTSNDPGADGNDPGKPQFRLGYAELKVEDATKRLKVDVTADRQEYRPANAARVAVAVQDAAGRPAQGEVTLWAVDYGILSLTAYQVPDIIREVYQEKALQVLTEDSRQRIVSRRVLTPKGDGEGGGGGEESGPGAMRKDFRPLAFWLGSVETDAAGRATRDVTLPESLTTYRIIAVAGDASSRFGSDTTEIRVSKPVTLVAAFPRFMGMGDRASFGGVVTNTLATGGQATITIRSLDPSLLRFQGSTTQTVTLGPNATEPVRFEATGAGVGTARVQMTVRLGNETDAFETTLAINAPAPLETMAAFGEAGDTRAVERLVMPAAVLPGLGSLRVSMASTALVGLGESALYLANYPFACAEQKASAAVAYLLASDLGTAFGAGASVAAQRTKALAYLADLPRYQCPGGSFTLWPGSCGQGNVYLTGYVLHVMKVAESLNVPPDNDVVSRALDFLEGELKKAAPPAQVQWLPVWSASNAFSVKVLAEYGRKQDSNLTRLYAAVNQLPVFALSYLADALSASGPKDARYQDVVRRITNAMRVEGDRAHVEEGSSDALAWIWSSNVRSTALVLDGFVRRGDDPVYIQRMVRWLMGSRTGGRWRNTQENATALDALVAYYRKFEATPPDMTATVALDGRPIGTGSFRGRTTTTEEVTLAMPDLLAQVPAGTSRELSVTRTGSGTVFYSTRLTYSPTEPLAAVNNGFTVERRYERYVEGATTAAPAATTYAAGDLIRVTLTITAPQERRYVAVSDALPAGLEAVDGWFRTTASDLAKDASVETSDTTGRWWFDRGGFDHVEKYDDRVNLFATRLATGRHQFTYLVRATTAGSFRAAGTTVEEMYAPEVAGRSGPTTLEVR